VRADKIMHFGAARLVVELSGKTPMVFLPASVLYSMFYKDRQLSNSIRSDSVDNKGNNSNEGST